MQATPRGPLAVLVIATACASLAAQSTQATILSPAQATTGTNTANSFPFNSAVVRRYLQLHGDLGVGVKMINNIAFRQICGTGAGGGARTMTLDMFVGDGIPVQNTNFAFDANYTAPKTQVMTTQVVNWGPVGPQTACPGTSPFEMSLPVSPPFPFLGTGTNSFVWEVGVHSNTGTSISTNTYVTTNVSGVSTITGTGCGSMTHTATVFDHGGIMSMNFTVTGAPASAPTLAALGATNPNLPVTGLCSSLLTDLIVMLPIGLTSATGTITTSQASQATFVLPNPFPGFTLYTQVHSVDISSTFPIPITNSNGRSNVVPALGSNPGLVARVLNNTGGLTATSGVYFSTSTVGYGLVCEFSY